jgi:hypothetical protein
MYRIVDAKPLIDCRVWIKFSDNTEGVVYLSGLKGKGVFSKFDDETFFNSVFIDPESHTLVWPGGIDLDPLVLYSEVTGKNIDELLKPKIAIGE